MSRYGMSQAGVGAFSELHKYVDWSPKNPAGVAVTAQATGMPFELRGADQFFGIGGPSYDYPNPRGPRQPWTIYGIAGLSIFPERPTIAIPALAFSSDKATVTCTVSDSPSGQDWSGGGYMAKYEIDTSIQLRGVFFNPLAGVPIDPSEVLAFVQDPDGNITTYDSLGGSPGIIRDNVGRYHLTLETSIAGVWTYKFQARGTVAATSPDTTFTVAPSVFIT